ncbi:MAG: hypothetical protein PHT06_00975 [Dehalococcoidales bacterium]|nr:hypothetical protein [Dehalococcoidales bacterium]
MMKEEDLIKKLESARLPEAELQTHQRLLKTALLEKYESASNKTATAAKRRRIPIMDTIKEFNRNKWLRPALATLSVVAIVAMLFVMQPWTGNNGYTTLLAKVEAAAKNVESYRMEMLWTADEIVDGKTYETYMNFTYEFVSDEITHLIVDYGTVSYYNGVGTYSEGSFENYYIGEDMYSLVDRNKARSFLFQQVGFYYIYIQSGQQHAIAVLDFMNDIVQLEDEVIDGVNCLHYIGTPKLYEDIIDMKWEIWLGEDDYLTRQIKVDHETYITTTRYYDYNVDISVDMPVDSDGNLKEGWEVEPIQSSEDSHLQTSIVFVPVDEALAALTGDEDWDDVSVVEEILMAMLTSTDWIVYFNALPEEGQQAVHDYVKDSYERSLSTTTKELSNTIGFDRTNNVIHYSNSATGKDVYINAGEITGENSTGLMDNETLAAHWVSTFTANDPQYCFDNFPVETREEMISMFYDFNGAAHELLINELYGGWEYYGKPAN